MPQPSPAETPPPKPTDWVVIAMSVGGCVLGALVGVGLAVMLYYKA